MIDDNSPPTTATTHTCDFTGMNTMATSGATEATTVEIGRLSSDETIERSSSRLTRGYTDVILDLTATNEEATPAATATPSGGNENDRDERYTKDVLLEKAEEPILKQHREEEQTLAQTTEPQNPTGTVAFFTSEETLATTRSPLPTRGYTEVILDLTGTSNEEAAAAVASPDDDNGKKEKLVLNSTQQPVEKTPETQDASEKAEMPRSAVKFGETTSKNDNDDGKFTTTSSSSSHAPMPSLLVRNEGCQVVNLSVSRPGAFAAAPSAIIVSRDVPNLRSLNERMSYSSNQQTTRIMEEEETRTERNDAEQQSNQQIMGSTTDAMTTTEQGLHLIEAFKVEEEPNSNSNNNNNNNATDDIAEDLEQALRKKFMEEAVPASVILEGTNSTNKDNQHHQPSSSSSSSSSLKTINSKYWKKLLVLVVVVFLIVSLTVGLLSGNQREGEGKSNSNHGTLDIVDQNQGGVDVGATQLPSTATPSNTQDGPVTLQGILERGFVRCGRFGGLGHFDSSYDRFNFEVCPAIAAAVFGDRKKYEAVDTQMDTLFSDLQSGKIDVMIPLVTHTMGRDVVEASTHKGFSFSYPFQFSGIAFGGVPAFVDCAERFDSFDGICRGLQVCVGGESTSETIVAELLPGSLLVTFGTPSEGIELLNSGACNVIAVELSSLNIKTLEEVGLSKDLNFTVGNKFISKDPLCVATVDGSVEWSALVDSVAKILITAEAMNFTKDNVADFDFDPDLDERLKDRIINVVSAVGNYGDLYWNESYGSSITDPAGINAPDELKAGTGLMYSYPFGRLDLPLPPSSSSQTMGAIQKRGYLQCGITESKVFAEHNTTTNEYTGFYVEYCRALASALFVGDATKVEFTVLDEMDTFASLADGSVDVLAGERMTLMNEFFEPTTGLAYSFSSPIFYGDDGSIWGLATLRTDELWSSFVFWTTMALIHAEERGISFSNAVEMPAVNVFGDSYIQSLRDCIAGVGNYGDIYSRTLEASLPRSGKNKLNESPLGPKQIAYPLQ